MKASGLKRRPSALSSVNTGKNETVITRSEKKIDGPTSCMAATMVCRLDPGCPSASQCSNFLWTFSTTMIEASTMAPIATAIPPSDMIFAVRF